MQFSDFIASQFAEYLRDLESTVNIDCGSHLKKGVDQVGEIVQKRGRELGAKVTVYPFDQVGNCVYLSWHGKGHGKVFLIGHLDTVYPAGTVAKHPFGQEGAKILGPGAIDMKAGVWAGIYAASAFGRLNPAGFGEISMMCNTDEEVGSHQSRLCYQDLARGSDAALVLEPARENGAIVSARKGVGTYEIVAHGKAAHAGVEPERGANAILALAYLIVELAKLNGTREGLTVNSGFVEGGTKANVVADHARLGVDVRVLNETDAHMFDEQLSLLCAREFVKGVRLEFTGGITNPPMEKTARTAKLVEWAKQAGQEGGVQVIDVATGGGSDGNILAQLGIPVLDGLGPQGGRAHNAAEEYILKDSIVPRVTMLARLMEIICEKRAELQRV